MRRILHLFCGAILPALLAGPAAAQEMPRMQRNGAATQLMVDGKPFVALAGELHNSSASSPDYMAPIWDRLARHHLNTVIGVASWELTEPAEGRFDFTAVDDQLRQARRRGLRLVLIWFGAFKNAESTYAPSWVRRDPARFARAVRDPAAKPRGLAAVFGYNPTLSAFDEALAAADARAFAALMRHLRQVDREHTVVMVQVENEVGLRGDSRDRSPRALAAWNAPVPAALIAHLRANRTTLTPHLRELWARQGERERGTWAEVFGTDAAADEVFMAWAFGRYVDRVARAGIAEHPLPMFANAWLGPVPGSPQPGDYPSGGPVARMMDVWKAAAPSLATLAPDIYVDDFAGTLAEFDRADNPILVPEAHFDAGNLFVALGQHRAIGFSPFGVEDGPATDPVFEAYELLGGMTATIAAAQAAGTIRGFKVAAGGRQRVELGGYRLTFLGGGIGTAGAFGAGTGAAAAAASKGGFGLVIATGPDRFLIVGRGLTPMFGASDGAVEIDTVQEGRFEDGRWVPGRTLNGDERLGLFPADRLRAVRVTLFKRQERP